MINTTRYNITKSNFLTIGIITILSYLLNQSAAIYQCASIFTTIAVMANIKLLRSDVKKACQCLLLGILLSIPLYGLTGGYEIRITVCSLLSLFLSVYISVHMTNMFRTTYQFPLALFMSLCLAAIIDGFIMSSYFAIFHIFTVKKIINVLNRDLIYKTLYSTAISIAIYLVSLYKTRNYKNNTRLV